MHWHNREILEHYEKNQLGLVIGFWHENVLMVPWLMRNRGFGAMVSDSRDGEYIARTGLLFGSIMIRGSSSKGATRATRAALRFVRNGNIMSLTPDGPRGPAHVLQTGVLWLSALAPAPIMPVHVEVDRQWRFGSWDGQKLPRPFANIHVFMQEPYQVERAELEAEPDLVRQRVQTLMMENTNQARRAAGHASLPIT